MNDLGIGKPIVGQQNRDAIHVAIAPVVATQRLQPAQHIGISNGQSDLAGTPIGIVDPFGPTIEKGQQFWLFLYPGSITSLRHDWTHPAFEQEIFCDPSVESKKTKDCSPKDYSIAWMQDWAEKHTPGNYYNEEDDDDIDPELAFHTAIEAGRKHHIGPYESARDYIDDEWWSHWENITGEKGVRGSYFSCSC